MKHVTGFVAPIPDKNREAYIKHARIAAKAFKENGALQYAENWEVEAPDGKVTSFPLAVQRKKGESIVFTFAVWSSKAAADAAMAKIMQDPRMECKDGMLFDVKRMIWGSFQMVVEE